MSKPVIAAISGHAVAGGLELALWCDLRVAGDDAILGVFCRRWGVPLIDGGTVRLPRIVGLGRALDLILTGRPVPAAEALAMGLVSRVVPAGERAARRRRWPVTSPRCPRPACAVTGSRRSRACPSPRMPHWPGSSATACPRWPPPGWRTRSSGSVLARGDDPPEARRPPWITAVGNRTITNSDTRRSSWSRGDTSTFGGTL